METDVEFKEFVSHFPANMSQALCDYATNVAFLDSRYIFTTREGRQQYGYCTHCRQDFATPGFKHGSSEICPVCQSRCIVKASGKGRKTLIDETYFVYYEKSVQNPEAITARGIYAVRDYREDYRAVETLIEVKAMYLFEPGNSVMYERPWLYYSYLGSYMYMGQGWTRRKSIISLSQTTMFHKDCFCSYDSIRAAIVDTPFQYSTWDHYRGGDMVKFFDLYSKYPCVEYLTKLGMRGLVDAKLTGEKTYGVINWRGKNPLKVLKMTKQEMKQLQAANVYVDPWLFYLYHVSVKDGSNLSFTELARIRCEIPDGYCKDLRRALVRTSLRRLDNYIAKQLRNPEVRKRYSGARYILTTWNDYIDDCHKLGLDLAHETVKFPNNLYEAHQNTIAQIKVKEDEALRAKMAVRNKALQKMRFEALGFIIRPAADQNELIEEGKALQHCVGTYASRYAKGETDIFVLRRADEPDKPFYTMEVRDGRIIQCRGLKNCPQTDEVRAFVRLFESRKLAKPSRTKMGLAM